MISNAALNATQHKLALEIYSNTPRLAINLFSLMDVLMPNGLTLLSRP